MVISYLFFMVNLENYLRDSYQEIKKEQKLTPEEIGLNIYSGEKFAEFLLIKFLKLDYFPIF